MQTNNNRYCKERQTLENENNIFCICADESTEKLLIQSDNIHLFDSVDVNTCDESCNVQDIVGKVELNTNGLDSGCNLEQCCMYLIRIEGRKKNKNFELFFFFSNN
jgi:hypothetical protein